MEVADHGKTRATGLFGSDPGSLPQGEPSRQAEISYKILGAATNPWGHVRVGFEGRFNRNRFDHAITKCVDGGSGMIGNEVGITLLVEALKLGSDGQPVIVKTQPVAPSRQQAQRSLPRRMAGRIFGICSKGILNESGLDGIGQ